MRPSGAVPLITLILTGAFVGVASGGDIARKFPELTKENVGFIETYIRPVLAEHCYQCHSARAQRLRGKLMLDSWPGIAKGGENGPVLIPGDVEKSRLIQAVRLPAFVREAGQSRVKAELGDADVAGKARQQQETTERDREEHGDEPREVSSYLRATAGPPRMAVSRATARGSGSGGQGLLLRGC